MFGFYQHFNISYSKYSSSLNLSYYMIKNTLIVYSALLCLVLSQSVAPAPYCHSRPIYNLLPMTINQVLTYDLSNSFTGYNLDIAITSKTAAATVLPKLVLTNKTDYYFTGLTAMHIPRQANTWSNSFQLLTDDRGATVLYVGTLNNTSAAPDIKTSFFIEYQNNTDCFDAIVDVDRGIAIVDCATKNQTAGLPTTYQNKFFYLDLATNRIIKQVPNQMYVPFTSITRRSMRLYHDTQHGLTYMIRAYYADGVDHEHALNTYIEFWSAIDLDELEVIRVIDRSYLGIKELAVTDFKIYLGDIFLLDYATGIYRLDILRSQSVVITGRYQGEHFTRMAIYSDDLDEQVLIALANDHAIYEINMDRPATPILVTKYTLPAHSRVHQLALDQKYVVVQSSANTTLSDGTYLVLNHTWIFTKGSRTYMNAFKVITHNASDVLIDLNSAEQKLMIVDELGIRNYQLNQPILTIMQTNNQTLNTKEDLTFEARSTDPLNPAIQVCSERTQILYVESSNMTIWPTGYPYPETYYSNYPGRLQIFLPNYAVGPNITYKFQQTMVDYDIPVNWINQQNQSFVHINDTPIIGDINFFHTDVVPHYGNDTVIYYYQDLRNLTKVARCVHRWEDVNLNCTVVSTYAHNSRILHFSTAVYEIDIDAYNYYYIFNLESNSSVVFVINFIKHTMVATIEFPPGLEGKVGHISSSNGILFITLPNIKTVNAYRLDKCADFVCPLEFTLDAAHLKSKGIDYFAPVQLITSNHHPEVLFVKSLGSVIILDVDNEDNIIVLQEIFSNAIVNTAYKIAVNRDFLVIVAAPNMIEEYSLMDIYFTKKAVFYKSLPLYNYTIPTDFDLEYSDFGDLLYINTLDTATNLTTILIYRSGVFTVGALYDVINLPGRFAHQNLEIEVSGYFVDYVSIIASGSFLLYRQYEFPMMVVQDTFSDFQFYVHYSNHETSQNLSLVSVKIANYPEGFNPTPQFLAMKNSLKFTSSGNYTYSPRKWFTGHVMHYNYSCQQCHTHIKLRNHIAWDKNIPIGGVDYAETMLGGMILWQDLFKLHINGSISEVILLPDQKIDEECIRVTARVDDLITATACQIIGGGVNVYITSQASEKGFTWGPYRTGAYFVAHTQMRNDLLMIVDVDPHPEYGFRAGGIFLYTLSLDPISGQEMDEIQYIDSNDFQGAHGWDSDDAFIGNAHLFYDGWEETYRLYVTELFNGLFVLDFKYQVGNRELNVLTTNYINLNELIESNGFHMPMDATFSAVILLGSLYNPHFDMQNILVTTNGYHNFEITIIYDDDSHILSTVLHRVYYRYAFYNTVNYVRAADDYVAIGYVLPEHFKSWTFYPLQVVALYDARDYEHESEKGYSQRYMLGGHVAHHDSTLVFGFNRTYNERENGTRIGLVIADPSNNTIYETSISRNLTLEVHDKFKSQKIELLAYSDFHQYNFTLDVVSPFNPAKKQLGIFGIILIVVSCVVGVGLISYVGFLFYRKRKLTALDLALLAEEPDEPNTNVRDPDAPSNLTPALNESIAYSESVRNTLNDQSTNVNNTEVEADRQPQEKIEEQPEEGQEQQQQGAEQQEGAQQQQGEQQEEQQVQQQQAVEGGEHPQA